ncbi:MAG: hypothetical protein ACFFD4_36230, partial [Candidatus Odinarchaeota archaeon]
MDESGRSETEPFTNLNVLRFIDAQVISDFFRYFRNSKSARLKVLFKAIFFSVGVLMILLAQQYPKFNSISVIQVLLITITFIFPIFLLVFAFIEFNDVIFKVESSSLLAVSELMAVLQTSRNLETGIIFLKDSDYPIISEICQETILTSSIT